MNQIAYMRRQRIYLGIFPYFTYSRASSMVFITRLPLMIPLSHVNADLRKLSY
jgi:hypothetical protein